MPRERAPASAQPTTDSAAHIEAIRIALATVRPLLPSQPPLRVFIALNTLSAFQHLPFHEAVARAHELLGAEPYLAEERFRALMALGRINDADLAESLATVHGADGGESFVDEVLDERSLRSLLMQYGVREETPVSLDWLMRERRVTQRLRPDVPAAARARFFDRTLPWLALKLETSGTDLGAYVDALEPRTMHTNRARTLADELEVEISASGLAEALRERGESFCVSALWAACVDLVHTLPEACSEVVPRVLPLHRDLVRAQFGEDVFDRVFPALIRVSAAYVDDGLAHWSMPDRQLGFYACVRNLVADGSAPPVRWMEAARRDFTQQRRQHASAEQTVLRSLQRLGVPVADTTEFIERLLLTLPGWAGMMARLEDNPGERSDSDACPTLLDFLAVRLTYELAALSTVPGVSDDALPTLYSEARARPTPTRTRGLQASPRAYALLQIFQLAGVSPAEVRALSQERAGKLLEVLDSFDSLARRRVFQAAFERHYRVEVLDALAAHRRVPGVIPAGRPRFQFVTCFDDREESLRRHLEELEPNVETFGAPGFFGAAIRFRGLDMRSHVPLAPLEFDPEHHIEELPNIEDAALSARRMRRRSLFASVSDRIRLGTRSLFRGVLLNVTLGLLATFPLVMRVASPRAAGRLRAFAARVFLPNPRTELTLHREDVSDGPKRGFNIDERVARVATVFENIGLTKHFARLVVLMGHGATTLNNPHASAYDCGACSGRKGGPNARLVARMANDPEVRAGLRLVNILVPDDTVFVGAEHDTCSDDVRFFDVLQLPQSHAADFAGVKALVRRARARDAHERCRRMVQFSAPPSPSTFEALRHVQARAEHLAEPRPELGHQANAIAIIGRRCLTRGLFLDRRAFALSYDPNIDPSGAILARSLAAAAPVIAGINLQYYFSAVDPERYGAGSKLPHNVVGLVGVMTGHASDLRTGLPRQMVDVHEPLRVLFVVETSPGRLLEIAHRTPEIKELIVNHWVQLVALDPGDGSMHLFTDRGFVPYEPRPVSLPVVESSRSFYRGKNGPLPPARIVASTTAAA